MRNWYSFSLHTVLEFTSLKK